MTQPLFLVGPRGCGKTTTGMALAKAIDFQFVDTDRWLQSHVQMTVAEIVEREGWEGFRAQKRPLCRLSQHQQRLLRPAAVLFLPNLTVTTCAATAWLSI